MRRIKTLPSSIFHSILQYFLYYCGRLLSTNGTIEYLKIKLLYGLIPLLHLAYHAGLEHHPIVSNGIVKGQYLQRGHLQTITKGHPLEGYPTPSTLVRLRYKRLSFSRNRHTQLAVEVHFVDFIYKFLWILPKKIMHHLYDSRVG